MSQSIVTKYLTEFFSFMILFELLMVLLLDFTGPPNARQFVGTSPWMFLIWAPVCGVVVYLIHRGKNAPNP